MSADAFPRSALMSNYACPTCGTFLALTSESRSCPECGERLPAAKVAEALPVDPPRRRHIPAEPPTRRRIGPLLGTLCILAVAAGVVIVAVIACVTAYVATRPGPSATHQANETVVADPVTIRLVAVAIRPDLFAGTGETDPNRKHLEIRVHVVNRSATPVVRFAGWRDFGWSAGLTDEYQNEYHNQLFSGPSGQATLYPGQETDESLSFECSAPAARTLTCRLPLGAVGQSGEVLYAIPIAGIAR